MKKIELMHSCFGKGESYCGACKYYRATGSFPYYEKERCLVYGKSAESDCSWWWNYKSCGLYDGNFISDKPYIGRDIWKYADDTLYVQETLF